MTQDTDTGAEALPQAVVAAKSRFSIVWLVPVVAALIGAWLVYKAVTETGPTITIDFATGAGLVAGKTKIKYKDVEIGHVTAVEILGDLSGVRATAEMAPGAKDHLTEETRFWVVRARLAAGEVSGLGTLLSGAYLAMQPSTEGKKQRAFVGLEKAPVITPDTKGTRYVLNAEKLGSIDIGAPVYFRQIRVGRVVDFNMEPSGKIRAEVFVRSPHDARVKTTTRFWNAGGFDVSLNAEGLQIDSESLVTMLVGGIAFDTPAALENAAHADTGHEFHLYDNLRASESPVYELKRFYEVIFEESIRGLSIGAPIDMLGFELGRVAFIEPFGDVENGVFAVRVVIEVQPERYPALMSPTDKDAETSLKKAVAAGLRAKLSSGNLITGQKMISFGFFPNAPAAEMDFSGEYPTIPALPGSFAEVAESIARIAQQLEQVPLQQIGEDLGRTASGLADLVNSPDLEKSLRDLSATLAEFSEVATNLNANVSPALTGVIEEAERTLGSVRTMVDTNSAARNETKRLLIELTETAQAIRMIVDYLERHPEALIRGKGD
ncbi:MAG: MlaD family protein [Chromatiales bacterium]|jgi:paraquat-inducible protein B